MKSVILIGAFLETIELCEKCGYIIEGIFDNTVQKSYFGYPVLGTDNDLVLEKTKYHKLPLVIVPDQPAIREKLYLFYKENGFKFETVISPCAIVSRSASVGEGSIVQDFCNISAQAQIGKCVRINSCSNIMHESVIGDFATIAPNAVVLGRCTVDPRAYIGANATILPERTVGKDAVVGAAAVVTRNIQDRRTVVGNPARDLKGQV